MTDRVQILTGDAREMLRTLPNNSVHCVVTSPPYFGLRSYGGGNRELGTEATLAAYIANLVDVFQELWRVMRPDATAWLNLGDSYSSGGRSSYDPALVSRSSGLRNSAALVGRGRPPMPDGIKPKDLLMVPHRVAMALQDSGWYVRGDVVWDKPNPMPESVTDRPTRSHEYIFLLAKQEKYYYDNIAIAEPLAHPSGPWGGRSPRPGIDVNGGNQATKGGFRDYVASGRRNKRDVWRINTQPYKGAHFAVFPEALVTPCILAGSSERGCCSECGAPWKRVVERKPTGYDGSKYRERAVAPSPLTGSFAKSTLGSTNGKLTAQYETTDWEPRCACGAPAGMKSDDLELVDTPLGERVADDPTLLTGRAGYNRPRGDREGRRPITRYEQRAYAEQLRLSPDRATMEHQAGEAFAHYVRTDRSGARPIPPDLLETWIERGYLTPVVVPAWNPPPPVPCTVLDPFCGSGTSLKVALKYNRNAIGIELNPEYVALAQKRIHGVQPVLGL